MSSTSGISRSSISATSPYAEGTPKAAARVLAFSTCRAQTATTSTCGSFRQARRWCRVTIPAPAMATRILRFPVIPFPFESEEFCRRVPQNLPAILLPGNPAVETGQGLPVIGFFRQIDEWPVRSPYAVLRGVCREQGRDEGVHVPDRTWLAGFAKGSGEFDRRPLGVRHAENGLEPWLVDFPAGVRPSEVIDQQTHPS